MKDRNQNSPNKGRIVKKRSTKKSRYKTRSKKKSIVSEKDQSNHGNLY